MTTKHTPGPWRAVGHPIPGDGYRVTADATPEYALADVRLAGSFRHEFDARREEAAANARLIAQAPVMFEALRRAAALLKALADKGQIPVNAQELYDAWSALEAATGGER